MNVYLGNLSAAEIVARMSVEVPSDVVASVEADRQERINGTPLAPGKWHCYDMPFLLVASDHATARVLFEKLGAYCSGAKVQLGIAVQP